MTAILISAFPGLGKTYLYQQYKDRLKILDLSTDGFEDDEFPGNYISEIVKRLNDYDLILLSSNKDVRYALNDAGIDFDLFYPSKERKNELIEIYVKNRKSRDFIMNLDHNFNSLIDEIEDENLEHCFKHKLDRPHSFVSENGLLNDFFNSFVSSNEGNGYQDREAQQAEKKEKPQVSKTYEDIQLRNIISLIDKCKSNIDDDKDIPDKFDNITITSDEYNALLYARTKLISLS